MKVKLETLFEDYGKLQKLCKEKFPIKPSYWIGRIFNKVTSEINLLDEQREKMAKELGTETNNVGQWKVKDEHIEQFSEKMKELLAVEVDMDFEKIDIKDLGEIQVEPELLLEWIFKI